MKSSIFRTWMIYRSFATFQYSSLHAKCQDVKLVKWRGAGVCVLSLYIKVRQLEKKDTVLSCICHYISKTTTVGYICHVVTKINSLQV